MTENESKVAFIVAITKLADDPSFRKAFLDHYHHWLNPPMLVDCGLKDVPSSLLPGHITYVSR